MICPFCLTKVTNETQYSLKCTNCILKNNLENVIIYHKDSKVTGHSITVLKGKHRYLIMAIYEKDQTTIYYGVYNSTLTPLTKLKNYTGFTPSNAKQKLQSILTFL